ncbi:hypothetical protein GCM10020331_033660 [Ectobacillus funiculus]
MLYLHARFIPVKHLKKKIITAGLLLATVRPNNIAPLALDESRTGETKSLAVTIKDLRTTIKEVVRKAAEGVDLSEAKVVIAGGRGVKKRGRL